MRIALMLAALCLMPAVAGAAAQPSGIAAVILLDSSGSMKHTDPQRLRVPAAQLFLSLLDARDLAGVVSFSDQGYPVVHLTAADESGRKRLLAGAEKASSKGAYTNLYAALERGMKLLRESDQPVRGRYLILLSDGHMDTGDAARDAQLSQAIESELLPALRERGIRVYSLAFTRASDTELLRDIAQRSDGAFRLVESQDQLHDAFADIFENAKAPNMLPMDAGGFDVDDAVQELTVVASHGEDAPVTLRTAADEEWQYRQHPDSVRWMHSPRFDLITVTDPAPGRWRLDTGRDDNRAYVVTNLELATDLQQTQLQQGETLQLRAWLTDDGEPLHKPEVLAATEFLLQLQPRTGPVRTIALSAPGADGVATAAVPVTETGTMQLTVIARSGTFERQVRHRVEVLAGETSNAPAPPRFVVPPIALPVQTAPADTRADIPRAQTPTPARPPASTPAQVPEPGAAEEQPLRFATVLVVFLLANGVLGVVIGAVLVLRNRRRARATGTDRQSED